MTKLGTRGPLLLMPITLREDELSFSLFLILDPYRMDQYTNQLLQKRLLESWSSKDPTWGGKPSILVQNRQNSPLFCNGPAKNQLTELIRL
jgi:hypothetical protein